MVPELVETPYGRPAAVALHAAVTAAKAGEPLAPVTVVVPSNHVGVATRRLLSSGALGPVAGTGVGLAAVTFLTTFRLAELLGAARLAGSGRRPVSTPVLAAAMRAELTAGAGLFAPVAEHPATESALVATYRELRDLSSGALDALAATSARAAEVVRLHRAVRARLEPAWSDEQDLLAVAAEVDDPQIVDDLGALVVHLPQRLSRHGAHLLTSLAQHVPTTVIAGRCGKVAADAEVTRSLALLGLTASADPPEPAVVDPSRTRVLTASDSDEEVRAAVRAVVDAVRAGTRLDRIALLHASPDPYARLAHDQLRAAGIRTNGAAVVPLSARVAGRTLLQLLALPASDFARQDVFSWLASAPIVQHGGRFAPTTSWERISRDAAVVSGRMDWDVHLEQHALLHDQLAERDEADDEQPLWRTDRDRETAAHARALRAFVLDVIDDLSAAAAHPRPWSEHAAWATGRLHDLLGSAARRERWDQDERAAAERVERAVERLGALDAVEGPVLLDVFQRTLELELDQDLGRVGRFGEGVLVGSVEMGIGLDLDLVVILGLAEGTFPSTVRDDSLLPDHERAATGDELPPRADRVGRQHRQLLASLSGASQQLLGVPRGDLRRSVGRVTSRWVLELCPQLDPEGPARWAPHDLDASRAPWVTHVASFEQGLRRVKVPATAQEHRLRALLAAGGVLDATTDADTARGAEVIVARRSSAFTRFDGNLSGLPVPSPIHDVTSPTRLERWASCPHRYLMEDLLRAAPVENPEDNLTITPIDKGSLVHDALERFLLDVLARPEALRPGPGAPWTAADHAQLQDTGRALCDQYEAKGLVGRHLFWRRDRREILSDLERTLREDSAYRAPRGLAPMAAELGFGFDGVPHVEIRLADGRSLKVRGRIDRVDRGADGSLHVIDYKTGGSTSFTELSEDDPVQGGKKLQLPIYGLAGRLAAGDPTATVYADYWFITSERGRFKRIGLPITTQVQDITTQVIGQLVEGIEAGIFPARPNDRSTRFFVECHACDPDGLGTAELRHQWEHKRADPLLAAYAALAEPDDVDDAG